MSNQEEFMQIALENSAIVARLKKWESDMIIFFKILEERMDSNEGYRINLQAQKEIFLKFQEKLKGEEK